MKVVLTKELENVFQEQVKTGLYKDAGEVIRNAIRQTYCANEPDPYLDSAEIAKKVRHARNGNIIRIARENLTVSSRKWLQRGHKARVHSV
jgi:Arc/MetJ-type ribon-helix-helix transcriptional regulator